MVLLPPAPALPSSPLLQIPASPCPAWAILLLSIKNISVLCASATQEHEQLSRVFTVCGRGSKRGHQASVAPPPIKGAPPPLAMQGAGFWPSILSHLPTSSSSCFILPASLVGGTTVTLILPIRKLSSKKVTPSPGSHTI